MIACKWPGCVALVPRGTRHCAAHQPRAERMERDRQAVYDRVMRDADAKRFYGSPAWLAIRQLVLSEQPVCQHCNRAFANQVDHILPRSINRSLELERSNLQALCQRCHSAKTMSETKAAAKAGK